MDSFNLQASQLEKIQFGMGCFWGPDSRFGSLPGVISTLTGYAGGTTPTPTYRTIGDHTETVEVVFDPSQITYEQLLRLFWTHHDATKDRHFKNRQYLSLLILQNESQREIAEKVKAEEEERQGKPLDTEIQFKTSFHIAEDRHQKYFLRRFKMATENIQNLFPDQESFNRSTVAARLNGFIREHRNLSDIKEEIKLWGLPPEQVEKLEKTLLILKW